MEWSLWGCTGRRTESVLGKGVSLDATKKPAWWRVSSSVVSPAKEITLKNDVHDQERWRGGSTRQATRGDKGEYGVSGRKPGVM